MSDLLVLDGLEKSFGPVKAVSGLSLRVKSGEVLGFLGPNGAGKSTTMKMAAGFLQPDAGRASICAHDVAIEPIAARRCLGYLAEGAPAYGEMTVAGFLDFCARARAIPTGERDQALRLAIERTGLARVLGQRIETLSKGFKRRVGLAQAIIHEPPVLILDEPTDGLDPNQKHEVRNLIRDMAAGRAIVVSTHILEEVDAVCTRAVIIDRGRIVADGDADRLRRLVPGRRKRSLEEAFRYLTSGEEAA